MPSYEYMKTYISTHPDYKKWKKKYMTEYMKKYRVKNWDYLNARRRELRVQRKKLLKTDDL